MPLIDRCVYAGAAALAIAAAPASATWSILIVDTRTGEIMIASATCVESIDLRISTPVLITGVGAVTAQSAVDGSGRNRMLIRDRLLQGVPLESILQELAETDGGHGNRQYGFITSQGETLTYSGVQNANWAGGITGRIEMGRPGPADDLVYSVQGNILTGPNVVQDAVDAIVNTDSDLAGRLRAAMLAAQAGGGDGRCSCSNGDPTGCGSPPPGPFKSAHVGYMLGTRADNIDAVRVSYPITNLAGGMTLADIDHNGMPDVVIGDSVIDEISIFMNSASAPDPLSHMIKIDTRMIGAAQTIAMSTGDFNNDKLDDVAIALASPPTLAIMLGQESGELADPISMALPAAPTGMDAGDLLKADGDEIVVTMGSIDSVQLFSLDAGAINSETTIALTGNPTAVAVGQLVGDEQLDMAITRKDDNSVWIGQNQSFGTFDTAEVLDTTAGPNKIVIADLNLDEDNEVVVLTETGRRVEIFVYDGKFWTQSNIFAVNRDGRSLAVGNFTIDDDLPDIVTTSSSPQRNLQVFVNDGAGGFDFDGIVRVGSGTRNVHLDDMNDNGNLDIVLGNGGADGLMIIDNPRGAPLPNPGRFADGDYYLELNVANQRADDPDPVDQLMEMFDDWRIGLMGKVDAVKSVVIARDRFAPSMSYEVIIELRDWQGELLSISDPAQVSPVTSGTLLSTTTPTLVEPGIFRFIVDAGADLGTQDIIIRVGTGADQVRLMPDYHPSIVSNLSDFNNDNRLNFFDVSVFLQAFGAQHPDADINGDGSFNNFDISAFLAGF